MKFFCFHCNFQPH